MKSAVIGLAALAALAGCGVDGAPVRPETQAATPGVSVTGDARLGVRVDRKG